MINNVSHPGFTGLGIAPRLLDVIDSLRFKEPTPIQRKSIPIGIEGKDLIAIAQTGTGKTLAFGIPMLQRLAQVRGNGLVLLPTRELAIQVDEALSPFAQALNMRTAVLIGGESPSRQLRALDRRPRVIIATPGRLLDFLGQRAVNLSEAHILVLDEADRMLDMGFLPQIKKIIAAVPKHRQTMLFSATMPGEIVSLARQYMELPISVEIAPPGTAPEQIVHEVFFVSREAKTRLLEVLLHEHRGQALVFTRTKYGAARLARQVRAMGHTAAEIHSERSLPQRREALEGFKTGKYRVLVATDIAARGIDVSGIEVVFNYDLPTNSEDYVHRIGRTGRAGLSGRAISFATFDQRGDVRGIEQLIKTTLPVSKLPTLPPDPNQPPPQPEAPREFVEARRPRTHGRRSLGGSPSRRRKI